MSIYSRGILVGDLIQTKFDNFEIVVCDDPGLYALKDDAGDVWSLPVGLLWTIVESPAARLLRREER